MSTISRTIQRLTLASAGVGAVIVLSAGAAGADIGAPAPEPTLAKISLTNAVITGVIPTVEAQLSLTPTTRGIHRLTVDLDPSTAGESLSLNFSSIKVPYKPQ